MLKIVTDEVDRVDLVAMLDELVAEGALRMLMAGLNVFGLFNANVREAKELLFEFEEPFVVDSSAYDSTFGESATRLDDAIPVTVERFRANPKR
jgi:hypothetical protein